MDVIEEIRSGNKEVVKQVYKENAKDVYNFAKTITGDHESALEATKRTFVVLFTNIRNGETPTNIRLTALKIAYDEACAIAMPSTDHVDSPYESSYKEPEAEPAQEQAEAPEEEPEEETVPETLETMEPEEEPAPEPLKAAYIPDEDAPVSVPLPEEPDEDVEDLVVEDLTPQNEPEEVPEAEPIAEETVELSPYQAYKANAGLNEQPEKTAPAADEQMDSYDEVVDSSLEKPEAKKKKSAGFIVFLIIDIILVLILLWFVYGLLINLDIVPAIDLGYSWFNSTIYNLFWL